MISKDQQKLGYGKALKKVSEKEAEKDEPKEEQQQDDDEQNESFPKMKLI